MSDEMVEGTPRTYSGALLAAIAVAIFLGLGGMIWSYTLSSKLRPAAELPAPRRQREAGRALRETDERLNVATDELKTSLGLTQKQLDTRAAELQVARGQQ